MVRLARRLLSLVCWGACVMVTAFVVLFAPAVAATVLEPDATTVTTSPAVNVKYIHGAIKNLWGVDIPYSPELKSDQYVVNMRYLLGMVDIANARLGAITTSYGTGEYATVGAVSKNTADKAIKTLIQKQIEFPFSTTVTIFSGKKYDFEISAAGTFYIDWGDGSAPEKVVKTDTTKQNFSHTYDANGTYTVKLGGRATAYSVNDAAVSFEEDYDTQDSYYYSNAIAGCLGKIFPTLANGSQPLFKNTFFYHQITSIPDGLFNGVHGAPVADMFAGTFNRCLYLTEIPAGLFSGISGASAAGMFAGTFTMCRNLTGSIPSGLFGNISGAPAERMFYETFYGCSGLTGEIPAGLFGNLSGAPAYMMFYNTFNGCSGLTGEIPLGLFGNLSGAPAYNMFTAAFNGCSGLTGASARNPDGTPLYDVFPSATSAHVGGMYAGTCLSDNASIPTAWGHNASCTYTEPEPAAVFTVTTVPNITSFEFILGASGSFTINWGDGNTEKITRGTADKTYQTVSHTYATAGTYTIGFSGAATEYPLLKSATSGENIYDPVAIYFGGGDLTCKIASMSGKLGNIFPTLADGSSPSFAQTFADCAQLTTIPADLFDGVTRDSGQGMFMATFADTAITEIPENLFATVSALGEEATFAYTFTGTKITTIPAGLFASITGDASRMAFLGTFADCKNLTEIPAGLFDSLNLDSIDIKISQDAFGSTFAGCSGLTGPSAQTASGEYLYDVWSANYVEELANGMYAGDEGLDDYESMPDYLKEASE